MDTITRKTRTLYEFNDEHACRRFANRIERLLIDGDLSIKDLDTEAKNYFGSGYKSECTESSWKDYIHDVTTDDITVHIWNSQYATMTVGEGTPKKELTLDDFRNDLEKAMKHLYDKYAKTAVLRQLDESVVMFKITEEGFGVERIYKEVH